MNSKRLRCAGVAWLNRHDHASGTLTVRPSANWATMALDVTLSPTKRGSLLAAVLIPCLHHPLQADADDVPNPIQFLRREALVLCQANRFEPELTRFPLAPNVNVPRFIAIEAVEEEPIRTRNAVNRRHGTSPRRSALGFLAALLRGRLLAAGHGLFFDRSDGGSFRLEGHVLVGRARQHQVDGLALDDLRGERVHQLFLLEPCTHTSR